MKWLPVILCLGCQVPPRPNAAVPKASASAPAPEAGGGHWRSVLRDPPERTREVRAPGKGLPGVVSDCASNSTTRQGPFDYVNTVWDAGTTRGSFEQCLLVRQVDGTNQRGWTWAWPGIEPLGFGFPEIVFGWRPWSASTTDSRLPTSVADVRSLTVRYRVVTESAGRAALALAVWFTSTDQATAPDPRAIAGQAVVWLDYPKDANPVGTRTATARVAGARYELWHAPNRGDRGDGTGWDRYTFKGPNRHAEGTVRLEPFLAYLVSEKLFASDRFVASVEFGSELMAGSGTTWVEDYDVQLATGASR